MDTYSKRLMESVAVACTRAAEAGQDVAPYQVCDLAIELQSIARRLRSFAEEDCNRGLSPARAARRDTWEQRAVDTVERLARALGAPTGANFAVETQRDPRGAMIVVDCLGWRL